MQRGHAIGLGVGGVLATCGVWVAGAGAARGDDSRRELGIRVGGGQAIVAVRRGPAVSPAQGGVSAGAVTYPHPRPRLAGFSPLIAITTSNKKRSPFDESPWEHLLESTYAGQHINPFPEADYVIGFLDSGSVVDLASDFYGLVLGLTGPYMTTNTIPIGGVGGTVQAMISQPVGFFAAGFSAINSNGELNFAALKGHSNVSVVVAPDLACGNGEELTAFVGTPFLAFYNSVIRVDSPRRVSYDIRTYLSPEVSIQNQSAPLPSYPRRFSMELGGISPVATASFFPDFEDLETPFLPTMLSLTPLSFPTGAVFFANVFLRQGPASPDNPLTPARLMVDTGAQSSIISPAMAANLSLPIEPDFLVDACGVGGLVENIPGYYVDYVKINASGGALEFSRAPFIVLDLGSPEGGPLDGILGMNFFWNRNVIFEPSLTLSSFFHVSDPVPFAAPDFDLDLHVDAPDWAIQEICFTGPSGNGIGPECEHTDLDGDGDVDLADFSALQRCFSGSDDLADAACGH
ncbi:MAG: retropepsin-like aspartic protease [Phycisphaerales bacterium]|nr:retropepsin-like aspartic protease [Phycisphaerales bacterium]